MHFNFEIFYYVSFDFIIIVFIVIITSHTNQSVRKCLNAVFKKNEKIVI